MSLFRYYALHKEAKGLLKDTAITDKWVQHSLRIRHQSAQITAFLFTKNDLAEKKLTVTNPFKIATIIKYLRINLTNCMKGIYNENSKTLMKEIIDIIMGKASPCGTSFSYGC